MKNSNFFQAINKKLSNPSLLFLILFFFAIIFLGGKFAWKMGENKAALDCKEQTEINENQQEIDN